MKAIILAGGLGTRLSEETETKPKPMVSIGEKPIIWHILKIFSNYGINDFIICCGYKGYVLKEYFYNYSLHNSDLSIDMENQKINIHHNKVEPWKITLVDTGEFTQTAGRLLRVKKYVDDENFCFTYGDGLSNVNISKLIELHHYQKTKVTLTAVKPPGRYGALLIKGDKVSSFIEKPEGDNAWINGGFFVVNHQIFNYIDGDNSSWEEHVLPKIAKEGELSYFKHEGFWQPMDTLRDKKKLVSLVKKGNAPWLKS